jgi:hypothetical protein
MSTADEKAEIADIEAKLGEAGYDLHLSQQGSTWVAALPRKDVDVGAAAYAVGESRLHAARNAWRLYLSTPSLSSLHAPRFEDRGDVTITWAEPDPRATRAPQLNSSLTERLDVRDDLVFNGTAPEAVVHGGAFLQLNGTIGGDVYVEPSASVRVNGMVAGKIVNRGEVDVFGVVHGRIDDQQGRSTVHPGGRVGS